MATAAAGGGWYRGRVKAVPSGDSLVLTALSNPNSGPPREKTLTLSSIITPRLARRGGQDEPFAWDSREFLRKLCVGKEVTFRVDYAVPTIGREFGTVILGDKNVAMLVVSEGWAKVKEQGSQKGETSPFLAELLRLEEQAKQQGVGRWSKMESILGFEEEMMNVDDDKEMPSSSSSNSYKLVPWLSWEEWDFIRESLFSSSSDKVNSALQKITTWRSRGCLPVLVDVTTSIIEIQLKDPYYGGKEYHAADGLESEQLLAMLYCMAIMRLVNCVVEKTRRRTEASIAEAANAIGIPRKLIDVRHEGSHRDLPALQVLRDCSDKALDWLLAYYWEPQKNCIPFQRDGTADIQREIKSNIQELVFFLKVKQNHQPGSSLMKGKRSTKKMKKCLKNLVRLYSTFSSEIVLVLLELLLSAFDSSNLEYPNNSYVMKDVLMSLDDWKPVITRFSNKEPELLVSLLKAVLQMIENEEAKKYETGAQSLTSSEYRMEARQIEHLSYLFTWLVGLLVGLRAFVRTDASAEVKDSSVGENIRNSVLMEVLRKGLLLSASGNKVLMDSSLHLAQLVGNLSVMEKLKKLSGICSSHLEVRDENSFFTSSKDLLTQQEDSILQAARKLEFVKNHRMKRTVVMAADGDVGNRNKWVVAKSWNSCPIGMLPRDLGSSGRLPILDCDDCKQSDPEPAEKNEIVELKQCSRKREACFDKLLDNSSIKKMKGAAEFSQMSNDDVSFSEGAEGHLMIGGVWKKVRGEELQAIKSGIRILI